MRERKKERKKERKEEKREERSYGRLRNEAKKRTKESFKRLRTRGSRCERELPALGWRVCSIGVMGQLVSYRGSSVSGRKGTSCTLLHAGIEQRGMREREREREREKDHARFAHFPRRRGRSCAPVYPRRLALPSPPSPRREFVFTRRYRSRYEESALDIPDT